MFYYAVGLIHFFPLSLTWKFNTGTLSPMNWIGLSVCSTISVKPLELQSRHTHKHSLFLGGWARALKTFIQITHCNYKVLFRKAYTNTHTQNWLQSDWLLFTLYARTHSKCQLLQPTEYDGVLAFFHSIRNQFCLGRNHEDCYEQVIYVS